MYFVDTNVSIALLLINDTQWNSGVISEGGRAVGGPWALQ